jgi:hypothetical protein
MANNRKKIKWPDKAMKWLSERENKLWGSLLIPYVVCFKYKVEFFLWIVFIVVAGQLGTIINVVNRKFFMNWDWNLVLYPDSVFGSFYTYALVLIASLIVPLFTRIRNDNKPRFRSMTIVFTTLLIFVLILCAVFFSFASQETKSVNYNDFQNLQITVDVKQLVFFSLSIILAWYAFGLTLMVQNNEGREFDDDYFEQEKMDVTEIEDRVPSVTNDGKDTQL